MQKYANLVELEKCCQTHIFLQNFVLIQPRTSPPKICKIFEKCIFRKCIFRKCIFGDDHSSHASAPRQAPRHSETRAAQPLAEVIALKNALQSLESCLDRWLHEYTEGEAWELVLHRHREDCARGCGLQQLCCSLLGRKRFQHLILNQEKSKKFRVWNARTIDLVE